MITSKQRAELRSRANELDTTLMIGKEGITDALLSEADRQLEARELIKGKVLETAFLSAREASDELCSRLGAEGIQCVGFRFVIYRRSEKLGIPFSSRRSRIVLIAPAGDCWLSRIREITSIPK